VSEQTTLQRTYDLADAIGALDERLVDLSEADVQALGRIAFVWLGQELRVAPDHLQVGAA
jgi:hypothetical protein